MPKRTCTPINSSQPAARREKARAAFDAVVESIHEDHRTLEGQELWEAVVEVFGIARYVKPTKDEK